MSEKIKAKEIVFSRAEGPSDECITVSCSSFGEVNRVINQAARTAPALGGYDKCDFSVVFEDGETYKGRYDMVRDDMTRTGMLEQHMRSHMEFYAGLSCPPHMTAEEYAGYLSRSQVYAPSGDYAEFLVKYRIGDE